MYSYPTTPAAQQSHVFISDVTGPPINTKKVPLNEDQFIPQSYVQAKWLACGQQFGVSEDDLVETVDDFYEPYNNEDEDEFGSN